MRKYSWTHLFILVLSKIDVQRAIKKLDRHIQIFSANKKIHVYKKNPRIVYNNKKWLINDNLLLRSVCDDGVYIKEILFKKKKAYRMPKIIPVRQDAINKRIIITSLPKNDNN